jgi:hypothetical protein
MVWKNERKKNSFFAYICITAFLYFQIEKKGFFQGDTQKTELKEKRSVRFARFLK